jgi:probable phosphoglycerate mutase
MARGEEHEGAGAALAPEPGEQVRREERRRASVRARISLLRHGEPDWTPGGGPSVEDPGLTSFGAAQARATAGRLAAEGIDALYVSPCRRARETAAPLAERTGLEPVVVPGLAEVGVAVTGLSQEDVDRYFEAGSRRPLSKHWEGWPGAESFRDFHARVTAAVTGILARHGLHPRRDHDFTVWQLPSEPVSIALVAHGGTNAVVLTHLLDIRPVPWEWLRFESELAAFSVLHARALGPAGSVWSLQNFNEVDPLAAAGLRGRAAGPQARPPVP